MAEGIRVGSAFVEVYADTRRAKEDLKNFQKDVNNTEAKVGVGADTAVASASIARVARDRFVALHVKPVNLAAVEQTFLRMSGARTLSDNVERLGRSLSNLDKTAPKIAKAATAIGALSGAVLAGSSNILVLAGSLASIAPATLALPGMFGAVAIGVGVMKLALQDAGTVLEDLKPAFENLQDTVSGNFWDQAAEPIRVMVNDLLPQYQGKLNEVATSLGAFAATASGHMSEAFGGGAFNSLFENLKLAIAALEPAIRPFLDTIVALGNSGSQYLPMLSTWLSRIATDFNAFVQGAAADGRLDQWITSGIEALQDLGRVVGNVGGIFYGLYTAAEAAGGSGLDSLANGLERINEIVNGPAFQGALTDVFKGGHDAMAGLLTALDPMGKMFISLSPVIRDVLGLLGRLAGDVLGALATALARPEFGDSMRVLFEGIDKGVRAIIPAIPTLVSSFGLFAETIGKVMAILGPVFAVAIEALAPVFNSLLTAIVPVAEALTGALMGALTALAPHLQAIAAGIAEFATNNPALTATLVAVAGGVAMLVGAFISFIPTIAGVIGIVGPLLGHLDGVSGILSKLGPILTIVRTAFMVLSGPIGWITLAITGLVATFTYFYTTSEPFRAFIDGCVESLQKFVNTIITNVASVLANLAPLFINPVQTIQNIWNVVWGSILTFIVGVWTNINNAITTAINWVKSYINNVLLGLQIIWNTVWNAILTTISVIWNNIINTVMNVWNSVSSFVQNGINYLKGIWDIVWNAILTIATNMWNNLRNNITNIWNMITGFVQNGLNVLRGIWDVVWNTIQTIASNIWNNIRNTITNVWNGISSFISSGIETFKNIISTGFNFVKDTISRIWNGVKDTISSVWDNGIKPVFDKLNKFIKEDVPGAFDKGVESIRKFWDKLKGIAKEPIKFMIDTVYNKGIRGVFNSVMDFIGQEDKKLGELSVPGFKSGGDTGGSSVNEVRGLVHGKEFVLNAAATAAAKKNNPGMLEAMNRGGAAATACAHGAGATKGAAAGGGVGFDNLFGGFQEGIRNAGHVSVSAAAGPQWQIPRAAASWDNLAGIRVGAGESSPRVTTHNGYLDGGILAWASGGDITFNTSGIAPGLSPQGKFTTAAHEIGHTLGLAHFEDAPSVMSWNLETMAPSPTPFDVQRLRALYGQGSREAGTDDGGGWFDIDPLKWITEKITGAVDGLVKNIPGAGKVLDMATGLAGKIIDLTKNWGIDQLKSFIGMGGDDDKGDGDSARAGKANTTLFDGGGLLERGMIGLHNKPRPDKVLTDSQWNAMESIAANAQNSNGTISNTYHVTMNVDIREIDDVNKAIEVMNGIEQIARAGRGTNLRRG